MIYSKSSSLGMYGFAVQTLESVIHRMFDVSYLYLRYEMVGPSQVRVNISQSICCIQP